MAVPNFITREYLQNIHASQYPVGYGEADEIISTFVIDLERVAWHGNTSYFFDMSKYSQVSPGAKAEFTYTISLEELIHDFQEKFARCEVIYKEDWVIDGITKKGIMIDWA
jgi:hypothetical protein